VIGAHLPIGHDLAVGGDDLEQGIVFGRPLAAHIGKPVHRLVEAAFIKPHADNIVPHLVEQRQIDRDADNRARVQQPAANFDRSPAGPAHGQLIHDLEIHRQVARLIGIDLGKDLMTQRVFNFFEQEFAQTAIQCDFQHRDDRAKHIQGQIIGVFVEPFDGEPDIVVGFGDFIIADHLPAPHQRHFGIGVALFLGVEIGVDFLQRLIVGLFGHAGKAARADMFNPHQIGHEGFELGVELFIIDDFFRTRRIPVNIAQRPLALFDPVEHFGEITFHELAFMLALHPCTKFNPNNYSGKNRIGALCLMARKPKQKRAIATVDAIVQAAIELTAEHGLGFLTTGKIAERAGVGVGSLYEYFDNKDDIVQAGTDRLVDEAIATFQPWVPELIALSPRAAVYELLIRMREFVERDNGLYLNFIRNSISDVQSLNLHRLQSALKDLGMVYLMNQPNLPRIENVQAKLYVVITGGIVSYVTYLADPAPQFSFDDLANALADMVGSEPLTG